MEWRNPGELVDRDLELILRSRSEGYGWAPSYRFQMIVGGERAGSIDLRVGKTEHLLMYAGQVGYGVERAYQGRHYAARSVRLLFPLARAHGLDPLWITCDPDNIASRRTCEIAGGELVEIVDVPEGTDIYQEGEYRKCRYRFDLQRFAGERPRDAE